MEKKDFWSKIDEYIFGAFVFLALIVSFCKSCLGCGEIKKTEKLEFRQVGGYSNEETEEPQQEEIYTGSDDVSNGYIGGGYSPTPTYDSYDSPTPQEIAPTSKQPVQVWHDCSLCRGTGRIVRDSYSPTYGEDYRVRCNECGRETMRSTGHSHITCTQCHGDRGYYTESYK